MKKKPDAKDLSVAQEDVYLSVDPGNDGLRLDRFIQSKLPWRSRTSVQRAIATGRVLIDGVPGRVNRRVHPGQTIRVVVPPPPEGTIRHHEIELDVLFEDRWLLAINKQPGFIVHPVGKHLYNTVINVLHHRYRRPDDPANDVVPNLVHRIDKDTSGLLLVAKDEAVRAAMSMQFERKEVAKEYLAIVDGEVAADSGRIDRPLAKDPRAHMKVKMAVVEGGLPSRTDYSVEERFRGATLLRLRPLTGRTHQIRVHCASIGHPLLPKATCVRNDVAINSGTRVLLISGSNMSGKSTLLRTVGINTVLAMAGAPVRAQRLRLSPLQVGANIRINDSLHEGSSRFYAEITRLRHLNELAAHTPPLLFLLDEVLQGTNSKDRFVGAQGVIRALIERGAIGLVTTHDLALTEIDVAASGRLRNLHFQDELQDGRMKFDFKLHEGIVTKSNGLELMRSIGLDV